MPYPSIKSEVMSDASALVLTLRGQDAGTGTIADTDRLLSDLCDAVDDALGRGDIRINGHEPLPEFSSVVVNLGARRSEELDLQVVLHRFRWYVISRKKAFDVTRPES